MIGWEDNASKGDILDRQGPSMGDQGACVPP